MTQRTVVLAGTNVMLALAVVAALGIRSVAATTAPAVADSVAVAVFEGRTPCAPIGVVGDASWSYALNRTDKKLSR